MVKHVDLLCERQWVRIPPTARFLFLFLLCPVFIEYKYKVNFTLFGRGFQVACVVRPLWYGAAMIVGWWDRLPSPAVMY